MDLGIKNKTALVGAASQGLGRAAALSLAQEGVHLCICARNKKELFETASEIGEKTGAAVFPVVADLSKPADIKKLVAAAQKNFGSIDILVNNAGGPPTGDVLTLPDAEWEKGFNLTLMSAIRLTREVLPGMQARNWGRIITIVSITAKQPLNDLLISTVLRPGTLALSKVVSNLYAKHNVTMNTVCPGFILTNRQKELMAARSAKSKQSMKEYIAAMAKEIPAGRMGNPEEVGDVIAFLASERASYISGTNLMVDGGMLKTI